MKSVSQRPVCQRLSAAAPARLAALWLLGAALAGCHHEPDASPTPAAKIQADTVQYPAGAPQLASLRVQAVSLAPLPVSEPFNAQLVYDEDSTVRMSAPVAGRVVDVQVRVGDAVKKNQVLAWIDSPDLGEAEADANKAAAEAAHTHHALERASTLLDGGVIAQRDVEDARDADEQAQAELARANLRLANLRGAGGGKGADAAGERLALRAPFDGVVAERHLNPGAEVQPDPQNPLFVVTDPSTLWAQVDLPEEDVARAHPGQPADLVSDALPDRHYAVKVDRIAPTLDATTRRVQMICVVPNADGALRPEMFARVQLLNDAGADGSSSSGPQALRVPDSALISDGLYTRVFVRESEGVFRKRTVTLAGQGAEYSYVSSGLKPGDEVVTTGAILLNNELSSSGD